MAKIIFGPIVAEARGRQGNLVFSRNQYGAYTSPYTAPDETSTPAREVVWTRMLDAATAWEDDLDDSQRRAWSAFAKSLHYRDVFHHRKNHSGRPLFVSNYFYLDALNLPINLDPPASTRRFSLLTAALTLNSDTPELTLDLTWDQTQDQPPVIVYATPPLSSARLSPGHRFKQIAALQDNATYPYNLWADYVAVHAAPTPGQRVFFKARPIHPTTGLSGTPLLCYASDAGTGDAMLHATLTLTPTQVKNLIATPIEVIPSPGPGKIIEPLFVNASINFNTTPYTIPDGADSLAFYLRTKTAATVHTLNINALLVGSLDRLEWSGDYSGTWNQTSDAADYPLSVTLYGGVLELTDGDSPIQLDVLYVILDAPA